MATYDNAIDRVPVTDSLNPIASGYIKTLVDAGYLFAGVATPSTNPGIPNQNIFYLASETGNYPNFGLDNYYCLSVFFWNGTWEKLSVLDFTKFLNCDNLFTTVGITEGRIINKNGTYFSLETFGLTDYIKIEGIEYLQVYRVPDNGGCFFDIDKNYISGFGGSDVGGIGFNKIIEVPQNAVYIRYNTAKKLRSREYIIDASKTKMYEKYPYLQFSNVNDDIIRRYLSRCLPMGRHAKISDNANLLSDTTFTDGKYLWQDGTVRSLASFSYTDYIDISNYSLLRINTLPQNGGCFYDADKNYISGFGVGLNNNSLYNAILPVPENAHYIRYNVAIDSRNDGTAYLINYYSSGYTVEYPWLKISTNQWFEKKIVWMGTSIPYGQTSESGVSNPMPNPYPSLVAKKLGATVVNVAQPGMAVETNSDGTAKTYGSFSLTIAELTAQGKATTPYKSYENAMLGQNADLYVFDCEPNNSNLDVSVLDNFDFNTWQWTDGKTFAQHRDSYLGAMIYLINQLLTENPAHRFVFVSEVAYARDGKITDVYPNRIATEALAEKLNAHIIDVAGKLLYNKLNRDVYLNSDGGSYLHPKVITHKIISDILCNELTLI